MTTWPAVEAALQGRAGWRRIGREYHGPCPTTAAGTDCAWFAPGAGSGGVRCGCRHCGGAGGRLDGEDLTAHLAAVTGGGEAAHGTLTGTRRPAPSAGRGSGGLHEGLAAAVWRAGVDADGTPGAAYLAGRGCWPGPGPVAAVRWLPAGDAARLRPRLPDGAAGALLYRFTGPGELGTGAVQCEAVDASGGRLLFGGGVKRPSVAGSDFDDGRRVFVARGSVGGENGEGSANGAHVIRQPGYVGPQIQQGDEDRGDQRQPDPDHPPGDPVGIPGAAIGEVGGAFGAVGEGGGFHTPDVTTAGVNLAEGPLDALALAALWRMGILRSVLGDRPIVGTAGAGGWHSAAVAGWPGPVTLWVQGDGPGRRAALRLRLALALAGRAVACELAPDGMDWADVAQVERDEREAIATGD